jgi:prolyl-tRNA editing enzyme YbaK/EbsC (Cys-tRNA(Pro) deacylase)
MSGLPQSAERVRQAAADKGLQLDIRIMPASTRTADEAAAACGTTAEQIVKSLIFVAVESSEPLLLLVSGRNRVNEDAVAIQLGHALRRPNAQEVRAITGFAIGGIPPIGHVSRMRTFIDPDLLAFDEVWAAAGTPSAVFPIDPRELQRATSAAPLLMAG